MKERVTVVIISSVFVAIGIFGLSRSNIEPTEWLTVTGRVVDSEVLPAKGGTYALRIKYEYEVGGSRFVSRRRNVFNESINGPHAYMKQLQETDCAAGKPIVVYYDPKKPAQAVLDPTSASATRRFGFTIAIVFGLLGVAAGTFGRVRMRRNGDV